MEVLYPRFAGLDVHKTAWSPAYASHPAVKSSPMTFNTTTASLVSLSKWLASNGSPMSRWRQRECTGSRSDTSVRQRVHVRAHQCRTREERPGPQDDINDATWLADLLADGLIRASFVPEFETRCARCCARANICPREGQPYPAAAEDARRCQHQAQFRGCRHRGQKRSDDPRCADRRRERSGQAGRSCRHQNQEPAAQATRCAIRRIRRHHRFMLRLHVQQIAARTRRSPRLIGRWMPTWRPFAPASNS